MVGNDIVDIAKAKKESNWQRPRFLDKLFTSKEQQIIHRSDNPFIMVWRLWSMKEAAYKLYTQINPSRFYNPKRFECEIKEKGSVVNFKNFKCYVETKITSDFIMSEASLKPSKLKSEVIQLKSRNIKSSSLFLKEKLTNSILENFGIEKDKLTLKKDNYGIPIVEFNTNKLYVSLTHHGNYGAFVIA
ncbi:MAG: 4-phosphopantetheinyl transferase family protein [Winogradskyella sp.]|uniref:4'-phosphopantetheinyl transferase family protein n=1 Tax=Winogradskyella sp. TaxID=1883156 RepID=UPI00182AE2D0|nr:4'-phosphopantetheinyl transferase superfamily protein [Winogradskyella sp.]MBT8243645.1 4'-phosphopantetheinyl transferase superfamily protein [Winogradskyella sp.]NNK22970.1 4-phosphopantetheinyl transferase family protein [Winogradskyella sp.]